MTAIIATGTTFTGPAYPLARYLYRGAAAVYSLRRAAGSFGDPMARLRRASDNAQRSFSAEQLADGTAVAWAAGAAYLVTAFDRVGGPDLMADADNKEPLVITNGALVQANGRPAIGFDGVDDVLSAQFNLSQPFSIVLAGANTSASAYATAFQALRPGYTGAVRDGSQTVNAWTRANGQAGMWAGSAVVGPPALAQGAAICWVMVFNGANSFLMDATQTYTGNPGGNGLGQLLPGGTEIATSVPTSINELAVFPTALTQSRAGAIRDELASWLGTS